MGKRQEAALLTRKKIIDAVKELLVQKSADSINIEDIVAKAGIAKGSFYTHFKRKEDAISVIAFESYDVIKKTVLTSDSSALENITIYLTESAKIIEKNTLEIAQNWMKSIMAPLPSETGGLDKYRYDWNTVHSVLEKAVKMGELVKNTPIDAVTHTVLKSYYGTVAVWCLTKGEINLFEHIGYFCNVTLRDILKQYEEEMDSKVFGGA